MRDELWPRHMEGRNRGGERGGQVPGWPASRPPGLHAQMGPVPLQDSRLAELAAVNPSQPAAAGPAA